jgi:chromosome segregation ATPase
VLDTRLLQLARELEVADERLAAAIVEVAALDADVAATGARAAELDRFLAELPAERSRLDDAAREAEQECQERRAELESAERELADAEQKGKGERLAAARRAVVRIQDALSSAERRLGRVLEAQSGLERRAREAGAETPELLAQSRALAARIRRVPRISPHAGDEPADALSAVVQWAAGVHAALFVVRSALESERERVVREANELGASALGEPLAATSVALVRKRLEAAQH